MEPRIDEAKDGKRSLYFVDGAHFVFGGILGSLWCSSRVFVKTSPGRQRLNVLAALNPFQNELVEISNTGYINAEVVCNLLYKIHANSRGKPITLVLDNARYQRCKKVQALADELQIELLFLPPYSPNLNLIERLWKFIKKECIHSRYFQNFQEFSETILSALTHAYERYPERLATLLTLKFQILNNSNL